MKGRSGEADKKVWFRTDRCFSVGSDWYFSTRENQDIGPFSSRRAALKTIPKYLKVMNDHQHSGIYARKVALNGVWAANDYV